MRHTLLLCIFLFIGTSCFPQKNIEYWKPPVTFLSSMNHMVTLRPNYVFTIGMGVQVVSKVEVLAYWGFARKRGNVMGGSAMYNMMPSGSNFSLLVGFRVLYTTRGVGYSFYPHLENRWKCNDHSSIAVSIGVHDPDVLGVGISFIHGNFKSERAYPSKHSRPSYP